MSETINLYQAKTTLSNLVERAAAGEEIIIAKNGRPMARLVPFGARAAARVPGLLKGQIRIADDSMRLYRRISLALFAASLDEVVARYAHPALVAG